MERKTKRLEKKKQETGDATDKTARKRLERDEERLKVGKFLLLFFEKQIVLKLKIFTKRLKSRKRSKI